MCRRIIDLSVVPLTNQPVGAIDEILEESVASSRDLVKPCGVWQKMHRFLLRMRAPGVGTGTRLDARIRPELRTKQQNLD